MARSSLSWAIGGMTGSLPDPEPLPEPASEPSSKSWGLWSWGVIERFDEHGEDIDCGLLGEECSCADAALGESGDALCDL